MRDDPFAKLGALDQKLFTETRTQKPARATSSPMPQSSETLQVGKEGSREVGKEVGRQTSHPPAPAGSYVFDINVKPYRKDSFLFTNEEFEAMEDLKLELRRKFDLKATKNDLARCAIGQLLHDYQRNKEASLVVRRLKTKK